MVVVGVQFLESTYMVSLRVSPPFLLQYADSNCVGHCGALRHTSSHSNRQCDGGEIEMLAAGGLWLIMQVILAGSR